MHSQEADVHTRNLDSHIEIAVNSAQKLDPGLDSHFLVNQVLWEVVEAYIDHCDHNIHREEVHRSAYLPALALHMVQEEELVVGYDVNVECDVDYALRVRDDHNQDTLQELDRILVP